MFFTFLLMSSNIKNLSHKSFQPWYLPDFFLYTIQTTIRVPFYLDLVCHIAIELTALTVGKSFWSIIHLNAFVQACNPLVDLSKNHLLSWWPTTHSVISDPFVHVFILQDILKISIFLILCISETCSWFSPSPHFSKKLVCQAVDNLIFSAIYGLFSLSIIKQ